MDSSTDASIIISSDLSSIVSLAQPYLDQFINIFAMNSLGKILFHLAVGGRTQYYSIQYLRHFALRPALWAVLFAKYFAAAISNLLKSNLFNYACLCFSFKRSAVAEVVVEAVVEAKAEAVAMAVALAVVEVEAVPVAANSK